MGTFAARFMDRLQDGFSQRGFSGVTKEQVDGKLRDTGFIPQGRASGVIEQGETIFARSWKTSGLSNFFVFTKVISEDRVIVLVSNPDQSDSAEKLERNEFLIRRDYHEGDPERGAEAVIGEAMALSLKKNELDYRGQIHLHHGYTGRTELDMNGNPHLIHAIDDGESVLADIIRKAVLYHNDVLAMTPHNNIDIGTYRMMRTICEELGIVCIPATEITAPLEDHNPNGPHILLLLANETAIKAADMMILRKRDSELQMVSLFLGMTFDKMLVKIRELVKRNLAVFGIAHPLNYNSPKLPIPAIGLVSAIDRGVISWDTVDKILREAQFVAGPNPTLNGEEVPLKTPELNARLLSLLDAHGLGDKITSHNVAMALGKEYGKSSFDGDDHKTTSTGNPHPEFGVDDTYVCGGDPFGMGSTGFNFNDATQNVLKTLGRKPTSDEMIRWIVNGSARLEARVFTETQDGKLLIARERQKRPNGRDNEYQDM
ncbi:TPA: hypothetical protein HA238_02205, partial [Candidatus Micrarchaeota archaeon]|nr:hypothetical protein [Candidatus Micrarchaeota archaeon]